MIRLLLALILLPLFSLTAADQGEIDAMLVRLRELVPLHPMEKLKEDPYETYDGELGQSGICAVNILEDGTYELQTFDDIESAEAAGYTLTHYNGCGACSSMQDLAVYIEHPDLATPVRRCGALQGIGMKCCAEACMRSLGFSEPCLQVWLFNASNTNRECFWTCLWAWVIGEEFSNPETGELGSCIQCDETYSGPIFKKFAGRTRRNSGLTSAINRPDDEVYEVDHSYAKPTR